MKKEYYQWLKDFKKLHRLQSINEAIYKLIDIHKSFDLDKLKPNTRKEA